jgi:transcriptional regulator with XRE-family HTH domain
MSESKRRPPIDRDVAKLIGATLRRNREALGWDRGRLCDATGYSMTFVANTEAGNGIGYPSKLAMRFMLDVMGADLGGEVQRVLAMCADRGQRSQTVIAKMEAFYSQRPGQMPDELRRMPRHLPPLGSTVTAVPPIEPRVLWPTPAADDRTEQMGKLTKALMALAVDQLDFPDVLEWCRDNARALDTTERMRLVAVLVEEYL